MLRCSLCGSRLDLNRRCTFCGLDNTRNDSMYRNMVNQNDCKNKPLTHVHTTTPRPQPRRKKQKSSGCLKHIVIIIVLMVLLYQCSAAIIEGTEDAAPTTTEETIYEED